MKIIKKLTLLLLLTISLSVFSQKSAKLQFNFNEGDKYVIEVKLKQDAGALLNTDIRFVMAMKSLGREGDNYKNAYSVKRVVMKMVAAGNEVNFDSDKKVEDMDEGAKKMRTGIAPLLDMIMYQTITKYGKVVEVKIEPEMKNVDQFLSQSPMVAIEYPKESLKIGSKWTHSQAVNGMKMKGVYTVKKISKESVFADFLGEMESGSEGKVTGAIEISRESGMIRDMNLDVNISNGGMDMKMEVSMRSTKEN